MHQTVREFFLRSNGYVANTKFRISEEDAHSCISITCIQYLILCAASITLAKRPPDIKSWTSKHYEDYVQYLDGRPLANYALCYLKHHIDGCRQDADVIDVTSQFIDALTHSPVVYLLESWVSLHLNKTLLSNGEGGAAEDFRDKLLHTAVRKGFTTAVEVLLTVGANVNAKGKLGRTPLSCAVEEGHEAVVRLLLAHSDVEADSKDKYSRTPLWRAAEGGHEALVRLLLARSDVEVDLKDDGGRTPLWRAAERGHEAVVRLLLEKGANPDSKDRQGRTVLFPAAENGHDAVMRLLLDKGADLDSTYRHGWTAMLWRRWT
jgi:ankyrin repeat domain-containing protein 50